MELPRKRILIVDDEEDTRDACTQALKKENYEVVTCSNGFEALERFRTDAFDIIVADIKMPKMSGIELLKSLHKIDSQLAVIMITGYADVDTAVESMREGAVDYVPKPFTPDELRLVIKNALERQHLLQENRALKEALRRSVSAGEIIGESDPIQKVCQLIDKVAVTDSTVLILGETGTGKELVARQVHQKSSRANGQLVVVNCAAIPADLLESELFGHEKGAFTGALRRKKGLFELADSGTLFLDEVGDMSVDLQAKLMRALQEREIQPVGSERKVFVDVRIVAATNRDLKDAIRRGTFREDLYYRLNVMPIMLPPLRERPGDIPLLADYFLAKYNADLKKRVRGFTPGARALLESYPWPGNVRELENAVERAVILTEAEIITIDSFSQLNSEAVPASSVAINDAKGVDQYPSLKKIEQDYILEVLQATRWNRKKASEILGISTVTLWRKIEESQKDIKE